MPREESSDLAPAGRRRQSLPDVKTPRHDTSGRRPIPVRRQHASADGHRAPYDIGVSPPGWAADSASCRFRQELIPDQRLLCGRWRTEPERHSGSGLSGRIPASIPGSGTGRLRQARGAPRGFFPIASARMVVGSMPWSSPSSASGAPIAYLTDSRGSWPYTPRESTLSSWRSSGGSGDQLAASAP